MVDSVKMLGQSPFLAVEKQIAATLGAFHAVLGLKTIYWDGSVSCSAKYSLAWDFHASAAS